MNRFGHTSRYEDSGALPAHLIPRWERPMDVWDQADIEYDRWVDSQLPDTWPPDEPVDIDDAFRGYGE